MTRILIADDHAIVRRGLRQILTEQPEFTVGGEASNTPELFQRLRERDYDVLVLDISMPGRSGLDVLPEVKQQYPKLSVLMLSMYPEDQLAVRALKAGASGYMTNETAPDELVSAVRKVRSGGKYVSATLAEKLATDLVSNGERPLHESLSD